MRETLHITPKMTAKMEGFQSLNGSSLDNKDCIKRSKIKGSVCEICYSRRNLKMYKNARVAFKLNDDIIKKPLAYVPLVNAKVFRLNAHGELNNRQHFKNIVDICNKNPKTTFSLWSKSLKYINPVIEEHGKPKNLILIYSTYMLDKSSKLPKYFDKVFTVYNKDTKVKINCHKACADCMKCYTKKDKTVFINELRH
jgi:hypothetical protein